MTRYADLFADPDAGLNPDQQAALQFYRQTVELRARIQLIQQVIKDLGHERQVSRAFGKLKDSDYKETMEAIVQRDSIQLEAEEKQKPRVIIVPGTA